MKIFDNLDIASLIISYRSIEDNFKNCYISKDIHKICECILNKQILLKSSFNKMKKKLFIKRLPRTYYTLKNKYINKEEMPILKF
jgi:hypothetical protein